jgi:ribonuclease D
MPATKTNRLAYRWIDQPHQLAALIDTLKKQEILAVDTESNSLFAYREQVCLIQFSTQHTDYLIDPLMLDDLSGLGAIFSNPKIEKVFHAAEYDLICLKRDFNFQFRNIFDTMHAGRILGRANLGLAAMLEENFGVKLDKKFQRANWGQRPLPDALKEYAHIDSHYLIALRNKLIAELKASNRWQVAQDDFQRISAVEPPNPEPRSNRWQVPGSQKFEPQQNAILKQLWEMRENKARQQNKPSFKVMSNNDLVELARLAPQNAKNLQRIEAVSRVIMNRYQDDILNAVQQGLKAEPLDRMHNTRPSQSHLRRLDLLKQWRTQAAKNLKVESDVVLPRECMEAIASKNPKDIKELREFLTNQKWRLEHFGKEILTVINPKEKK